MGVSLVIQAETLEGGGLFHAQQAMAIGRDPALCRDDLVKGMPPGGHPFVRPITTGPVCLRGYGSLTDGANNDLPVGCFAGDREKKRGCFFEMYQRNIDTI